MRIHVVRIPTPFPVGPVNAILVGEDPITLIDTGPKTSEAWEALRSQIEALGLRLGDIKRIVLTHAHLDHAGQAERLRRLTGATVYAHPWEADRLGQVPDASRDPTLFAALGVPARVVDEFNAVWDHLNTMVDPISGLPALDDGDELAFEKGSLAIVHTPGHTPGHICLFHRAQRTLIAADTVLKRITPNPILNHDPRQPGRRFPSLAAFLRSLDRLRHLAPALVYTGHGEEVDDYEAYYQTIVQHARQRQRELLQLMGDGAATAWEFSLRLFPQAGGQQRFLALSETIAHLDWAVGEGTVVCEKRNGVEYFWRRA